MRCEFWKRKIKIKIKRIGPSHTFEKAGYPLCLIKKKRKREKEKGRSLSAGYRSFRRRREGESEEAATTCAEKKEEKEEEGFKLFPEGI